ncbi:hypothetical protein [Rhodococcoides corynebacterioides]|uniref:hypothetical protein n=1 Tax=Rhodococcoides corynebacterioides TaxID=53972 RepID=UPI003ADD8476
MSTVIPLRPGSAPTDPAEVSVLVGAGHGGAGTTTTTLGIAAALAAPMYPVVAADTTSDGGNLFTRAAAAPLSVPTLVSGLPAPSADTTSGAVVLGGAADRTDPALIDALIASRGAARVFDAGTAVDTARHTGLRRSSTLVLCSVVRAEPLTRLREILGRAAAIHGPGELARTVVVLTHTLPDPVLDLTPVLTGLRRAVADVIEVPFDSAAATPGLFDHRSLAPSSLSAYGRIATAALSVRPSTEQPRRQENA